MSIGGTTCKHGRHSGDACDMCEAEAGLRKYLEESYARGFMAGIEAAAKECDMTARPEPKMDGSTVYENPLAGWLARRIRALRPTKERT